MMDYVYLTPKIITATFLFALIKASDIKNITLQTGIFTFLYYLSGTFLLGYDINWKELVASAITCAALLRSNLNLTVSIIIFAGIMSLVRPFCYIA